MCDSGSRVKIEFNLRPQKGEWFPRELPKKVSPLCGEQKVTFMLDAEGLLIADCVTVPSVDTLYM